MFKIEFEANVLKRRMTAYERNVVPFALAAALNDSMFHVRDGFKSEIADVFDSPTQFTLNSVLFVKATKNNLLAQVFIRNTSTGGTPPSKYLYPEAVGGARTYRPFERKLNSLAGGHNKAAYYTFGKGYPLNVHGNLPVGVIRSILGQLKGTEKASTKSRRKKRVAKKGGGGSFFILRENRGKLKAGVVYERIATGYGSAVRTVLAPIKRPKYHARLQVGAVAQRLFSAYFPDAFARRFNEFKVGVQ